jgi:N6-adenosine-specific RNA methylase IME4
MILTEPSKHQIVYIDCPWPRTPCGTAKTPYNTMTWAELRAFDLGAWLADDALVFAWVTGPTHLKECAVLSHWCEQFGLYEAGVPYIWVKTRKDGVTPIGASGPRPKLVKQLGEFVIALTTRKRGRVFPLLTEAQVQWVEDGTMPTEEVYAPKPPRGSHSRKPAIVRDKIVELVGDRSRVEIFARDEHPGWNAMGDELIAA